MFFFSCSQPQEIVNVFLYPLGISLHFKCLYVISFLNNFTGGQGDRGTGGPGDRGTGGRCTFQGLTSGFGTSQSVQHQKVHSWKSCVTFQGIERKTYDGIVCFLRIVSSQGRKALGSWYLVRVLFIIFPGDQHLRPEQFPRVILLTPTANIALECHLLSLLQ